MSSLDVATASTASVALRPMICLACAVAAALVVLLLASARPRRRVAAEQGASAGSNRGAPAVVRWCLRPLGRRIAKCLPAAYQRLAQRHLECGGLDPGLTAADWAAAQLIAASLSCLVCAPFIPRDGVGALACLAGAAVAGGALPWVGLRDRVRRRQRDVARELPPFLDLLTLGLEAGCAFGAALQVAVRRAPGGPLREALELTLQEMRAGRSRAESLQRMQARIAVPALTAAVAAIVQAEATGVGLAGVMRSQAARGTQERFARAEKLAMEAPVKMLAPLILCIFPCTFIVIGFPIAVRLFWRG